MCYATDAGYVLFMHDHEILRNWDVANAIAQNFISKVSFTPSILHSHMDVLDIISSL